MRKKFWLALLAVGLLWFGLWNEHGKAATDSVNTYEYMVILDGGVAGNVKGLNEYGAQGWELVSAVPNASNGMIVLYLKRTRTAR